MSDSCFRHEDFTKVGPKAKGILQFGTSTELRVPKKINRGDKPSLIANPILAAEFAKVLEEVRAGKKTSKEQKEKLAQNANRVKTQRERRQDAKMELLMKQQKMIEQIKEQQTQIEQMNNYKRSVSLKFEKQINRTNNPEHMLKTITTDQKRTISTLPSYFHNINNGL